jgi:hypothetical protein
MLFVLRINLRVGLRPRADSGSSEGKRKNRLAKV